MRTAATPTAPAPTDIETRSCCSWAGRSSARRASPASNSSAGANCASLLAKLRRHTAEEIADAGGEVFANLLSHFAGGQFKSHSDIPLQDLGHLADGFAVFSLLAELFKFMASGSTTPTCGRLKQPPDGHAKQPDTGVLNKTISTPY
jgi:hypothetical protein